MFLKLFALFVILPVAELALLVYLGRALGLWPALALVLITGALGAALAKCQGLQVWRTIQRETAGGRMPAAQLIDGLFILVAGLLLITPGLLTDLAGFALLLPAPRRWCRQAAGQWLLRKVRSGEIRIHTAGFGPAPGPDNAWDGSAGDPALRARNITPPGVTDDSDPPGNPPNPS